MSVLLLLLACSKEQIQISREEKARHRNEWIFFRSVSRNIPLSEAEKQDLAISEDVPYTSIDEPLKKEAFLIWRDMCALCHGINGDPKDSLIAEPKPKKLGGFGMRLGFLFGQDKMRVGIYKVIRDGKGRMPGFRRELSREQMWAVVRFLENL